MSSTFHVRGGRPLDGEITVRGAKNLVSILRKETEHMKCPGILFRPRDLLQRDVCGTTHFQP